MDRDMLWRWDQVLKTHPNGMRFSCFGQEGELLATNEYFRYITTLYAYDMILSAEPRYFIVSAEVLSLTTRPKVRIIP